MIRLEFASKKWLVIGGVSFTVVAAALFSLIPSRSHIHRPVTEDRISYSYEMPRLQAAEVPFDLSGRRVVRKYPDPKGQPVYVDQKVAPIVAKGTTGQAFPKVTKKDDKAAKAKAAKAKAAKEQAQRLARRNHQVKVIAAGDRYRTRSEAPRAQAPTQQPQTYYYPAVLVPAGPDDTSVGRKDDDEMIDPSTWQSLLQAQPTATNVSKFMKARSSGKVADAAFFRIVTVLLQDNAPDRRKAGLQMLDQDSSPKTYEFLVLRSSTMNPDVQGELRALQAKYSTASKIFLLARVLASETNKTVLMAALLQLRQVATAQGPIPPPGQNTPQSGGLHAQLNSMLGLLRKVAQNPDQSVAAQAKAVLSALQKV